MMKRCPEQSLQIPHKFADSFCGSVLSGIRNEAANLIIKNVNLKPIFSDKSNEKIPERKIPNSFIF